jgi:hypothetical protein
MGGGVAGIEFNRFAELGLAAGKIPIVLHLDEAQVRMRAGQRGIKFQCLRGSSFRLGGGLAGVEAIGAHDGVGIRNTRISKRIAGILIDGLIEIGNRGLIIRLATVLLFRLSTRK